MAARPALPQPISRDADRRITFAGLSAAAGMIALALASVFIPAPERHGLWLPLHLALAGAAGTAIAAVLPFFAAAIAVARPSAPIMRIAAIALVGGGALVASGGVVRGSTAIAVAGGAAYLAGLAALAVGAFAPLRGALAPRVRVIALAYGVAIAQVVTGVALATAVLGGFAPVAERWAMLKPAHAWLNVFGFLSLVVATSLVHLGPTVAGSRIRPRASAMVAVACLALGPPLIASGFALGADALARLGALVELGGAAALATHAFVVRRDRGTWTTDPEWHRVTGWSLTVAPCWFLVAVGIAAGRVIWLGVDPRSWFLEMVAGPLVVGWLVQVLIGSWSHLVPAIGPGDAATHARQRVVLGRWSGERVLLLNGGVVLILAGSLSDIWLAVVVGLVASACAVVLALALLLMAGTAARRCTAQPVPAARSGSG